MQCSFRNQAGILSGPLALFGLSESSCLRTPWTVITSGFIPGVGFSLTSGISFRLSGCSHDSFPNITSGLCSSTTAARSGILFLMLWQLINRHFSSVRRFAGFQFWLPGFHHQAAGVSSLLSVFCCIDFDLMLCSASEYGIIILSSLDTSESVPLG